MIDRFAIYDCSGLSVVDCGLSVVDCGLSVEIKNGWRGKGEAESFPLRER